MELSKIPLEAQQKLVKIMNDTPTVMKLAGTEFEIRSIKVGAAMQIAERVLMCESAKDESVSSALVAMAKDGKLVAECIAIAIANDYKKLNDKDYMDSLYELLMDCEIKDWTQILIDIISKIDVQSFSVAINSLLMFRELVAGRKTTSEEER